MTKRLINIDSCDDTTAFVLDMTDSEYAVAQRIAEESKKASTCGCQPVIETASEGEDHDGWQYLNRED